MIFDTVDLLNYTVFTNTKLMVHGGGSKYFLPSVTRPFCVCISVFVYLAIILFWQFQATSGDSYHILCKQ